MPYPDLITGDPRSIVCRPGTRERWVVELIADRHEAQTEDWFIAADGRWTEVGEHALEPGSVVVRPVERYDDD